MNGFKPSITGNLYRIRGASTPKPAARQAATLNKLQRGRIILGLGTSVKSAPLMPFASDNAPKANTMKIDSKASVVIACSVGW